MKLQRFIDSLVLISAGLASSAGVLVLTPILAVVGAVAGFVVTWFVKRLGRAVKHPYLICVAVWLLAGLASALLRAPGLAVISVTLLITSLFMVRLYLGGDVGTAFLTAVLPYLASSALFETYLRGLSLDRYFPLMCSPTVFGWAVHPLYTRIVYATTFGYLLGAYVFARAEKRPLTYAALGVAGFYTLVVVTAVSESGVAMASHVAMLAAAAPLALALVIIKALRL